MQIAEVHSSLLELVGSGLAFSNALSLVLFWGRPHLQVVFGLGSSFH